MQAKRIKLAFNRSGISLKDATQFNLCIDALRYLYLDCFIPVNNSAEADLTIFFAEGEERLKLIDHNFIEKTIIFYEPGGKERKGYREGSCVDQDNLSPEAHNILSNAFLVFSSGDYLPGFIHCYVPVPLSFNRWSNIQQPEFYWREFANHAQKNNLCFWSGSTWTHQSRNIVQKLIDLNSDFLDLNIWEPEVGGKKANPYSKVKPLPSEYISFCDKLSRSRLGLLIRGDRTWTYSFLDFMRFGVVPVCIDNLYISLGWEVLGLDPSELFLSFSTAESDPETILGEIKEVLMDKDRSRAMTASISNFYSQYIMTDRFYLSGIWHPRLTGFADFYVAKIVESWENKSVLNNALFVNLTRKIKSGSGFCF
jgi:hypothetical protein